MSSFLRTLGYYARITGTSFGAALLLTALYALGRGTRTACGFSDAFFYGSVLVIVAGGAVALLGGRAPTDPRAQRRPRQPAYLPSPEEREAERRRRFQERERAISLGLAIAAAGVPMFLLAWRLCPA
ncbi:MAG: hypothetical protein ACP5SI_12710 [Chloroflexia bacterium]